MKTKDSHSKTVGAQFSKLFSGLVVALLFVTIVVDNTQAQESQPIRSYSPGGMIVSTIPTTTPPQVEPGGTSIPTSKSTFAEWIVVIALAFIFGVVVLFYIRFRKERP